MKKNNWEGKVENTSVEYDVLEGNIANTQEELFDTITAHKEIRIDKIDCLIAASSGMLTAMMDILWVGEFSLVHAQDIGTKQINKFVIAIAQRIAAAKRKPSPKDDLKSCIKFLEKEYPLASDRLINDFGGGLQHHLRDFSHHASPFGLVCSILNQFTEHGYGTDTAGNLIKPNLPKSDAIGTSFKEKISLGVVSWFFHLISDMAGSSGSKGRGTGIPGPILSLAKVMSTTPLFKEITIRYKDDDIGFSVWISKLFNGTAFGYTDQNDLIRFDLRTELGVAEYFAKQSVPVIMNQCIVRSFYFVRRLAVDFSEKKIKSLADLKNLEADRFLPFTENRTITHMITISSGVFSIVDGADAIVQAKIRNANVSSKVFPGILFRLNFAGICSFAISIKNEIKYIEQNVKSVVNKKTKIEQILELQSGQYDSISQINVEVEMDNRNLYDYTFAELTNMLELSRDKIVNSYVSVAKSIGKIFDFGEDSFGIHKTIVEANEAKAMYAIEKLVIKICEQNNISFEYYPVDIEYSNCSTEMRATTRPFQMVRLEDGKRVGYVFCSEYETVKTHIRLLKKGVYKVDGIKIVRVNSPDKDAYELFYSQANKEYKECNIHACVITIKELFDFLFGKNEYAIFSEYVNRFNLKAREIVGFNTVLAPTEMAIEHFKKKIGEQITSYPYRKLIPNDIFQSQVKVMIDNYLNRELWRAMVGKADFAVSFISSEWNYQVYQLTENLDMTGVAAGYLKSIEQLLYCILRISEHKGISIKSREGQIIDFSVGNEALIDSTLGSLEAAIQHNGHILDVSAYVKHYLVDTIDEWREKQRNGYFHKHNLCSKEKLEEIRNKAIYLYFLILGSCTISDDQFEKLGIQPKTIKESFSYDKFVYWLEVILKYGLPENTVAVCLTLYDTEDDFWSLQFNGLHTFDKDTPFYTWKDSFSPSKMYKWNRVLSEKETIHDIAEAAKRYMEIGDYKHILLKYQAIVIIYRSQVEFLFIKNGGGLCTHKPQ